MTLTDFIIYIIGLHTVFELVRYKLVFVVLAGIVEVICRVRIAKRLYLVPRHWQIRNKKRLKKNSKCAYQYADRFSGGL